MNIDLGPTCNTGPYLNLKPIGISGLRLTSGGIAVE